MDMQAEKAATPVARAQSGIPAEARWREFIREFFSSKLALAGFLGVLLVAVGAIGAPWVSPQNPYDLAALDILDAVQPPGTKSAAGFTYLLGSDDQGRDMVSAILYGLRISLLVGVASAIIALIVGLVVGLVAAYAGGAVDALLMRIVDVQLSFPAILIALVLVVVVGQGTGKIIIALVAVQWAYYARTVRGTAMVENSKAYMDAAKGLGLPRWKIVFTQLLPNCLPPLIVVATLQVAFAIMLEATLSFLGIGLPITEPSLGLLIANGFSYIISGKYWISTFPGLALLWAIVSINLVGDRLRIQLSPRLNY